MQRRDFFKLAATALAAAAVVPNLPKGESLTEFPYKLGLKPSAGEFRLRLGNYLNTSTLPTPPDEFGHENLVNWWGMLGNDELGDCISPDTRVLTASLEWVSAGSIRVGDKLLGFDEDNIPDRKGQRHGRRFSECLVEKSKIVQRPCYELEFSDGTKVVSSAGHRWLTKSTVQGELGCQRWERTEDLRPESPRQTHVIKPLEVWETDRSWDAGYLAGAFDGEGNLESYISRDGTRSATHTRVNFSQTDNEMLHQVELSLKSLGFEPTNYTHQRHSQVRVDGSPRKDITRISIGRRSQFLKFMGSIRPQRLLSKMDGNYGVIPGESVALVSKKFIGEHDVVMLDTSSRTYFANGLASHNCAIAGPYHALQLWNAEAGRHFPINTARVVSTYSDVTGYDPSQDDGGYNPTDRGSNLDEVAEYWQKTGFPDSSGVFHKIDTYVALEPGDVEQLFLAAYLFDGVGVGIHMPSEWMTAFEAKKPWDKVDNPHVRGGHLVTGVARRNGNLVVVTWGALQEMTPAGYEQFSMETLIYLDRDKLVNGKDINGFDYEKLQHDIWAVAQCD